MNKEIITKEDIIDAKRSPDINIAWILFGSGAASTIVMLIRGRRVKPLWLLPISLIIAGFVVLFQQRQTHIVQVKGRILDELDTLDPVARAQIITSIAELEVNKYRTEG